MKSEYQARPKPPQHPASTANKTTESTKSKKSSAAKTKTQADLDEYGAETVSKKDPVKDDKSAP